jgi:hypothetical protein
MPADSSYALAELRAYLTVYDSLYLKYRIEVMVYKPHKNRLSLVPQGGADGFRGRVSQVRILQGPLIFPQSSGPYVPRLLPGTR